MAPGPPSPLSYLREHITHGYAITVHAAQGVTTATTHAVLGETTTRNLLYVAMTRGRESNQAYLYERRAGETEHEYAEAPGVHAMRRGTSHDASQLVRAIIATRDERARTAHDIAADTTNRGELPDRVRHLLDRRTHAGRRRRAAYHTWCDATAERFAERQRCITEHLSRSQKPRQGLRPGALTARRRRSRHRFRAVVALRP